ncbi:hypothetical protein QE152_g7916 [Popillia japonica]|uniref:Uncharacterized protein n=1 Tax=Popillia japonica TaxID=7064 RepID=A0AAW1ME11_POPJA
MYILLVGVRIEDTGDIFLGIAPSLSLHRQQVRPQSKLSSYFTPNCAGKRCKHEAPTSGQRWQSKLSSYFTPNCAGKRCKHEAPTSGQRWFGGDGPTSHVINGLRDYGLPSPPLLFLVHLTAVLCCTVLGVRDYGLPSPPLLFLVHLTAVLCCTVLGVSKQRMANSLIRLPVLNCR